MKFYLFIFSASTLFAQINPGSISSPSPIICKGEMVTFLEIPASGGSIPFIYQWQSSPDSISWTTIAEAVAPDYQTFPINAKTYFRRQCSDGTNIALTNAVVVKVINPPIANIGTIKKDTVSVAANNVIVLHPNPFYYPQKYHAYYGIWSITKGNGEIDPTGPYLTGLSTKETYPSTGVGTTHISWTVRDTGNVCPPAVDSMIIVNIDRNIAFAGADSKICKVSLPYTFSSVGTNLITGIETSSWSDVPIGTVLGNKVTIPIGTPPGKYKFTFQIANTQYGTTKDDVIIHVLDSLKILQNGIRLSSNYGEAETWYLDDKAFSSYNNYATKKGLYKVKVNNPACIDSSTFQFNPIYYDIEAAMLNTTFKLKGASYRWMYNGSDINDTDSSCLVTKLGRYSVIVSFYTKNNARLEGGEGGGIYGVQYDYDVTVLGFEQNTSIISTSVFPNPFQKEINIQRNEGISSVILWDVTGLKVIEKVVDNSTSTSISSGLESLHSGIYLLEMQLGNGKRVFQKLVKTE